MEGTIRQIQEFQPESKDFSTYTKFEIKRSVWLLTLIGSPVGILLGQFFEKFRFFLKFYPIRKFIESTIFKQFCGGTSLEGSKNTIDKLSHKGISTVLDYAGEGFKTERDFDLSVEKILESIRFASENKNASTISMKITSIGSSDLLEKYESNSGFFDKNQMSGKIFTRLESICSYAKDKNVAVFIDAEESWLQQAIDDLAVRMMALFNQENIVVYNTYQLYLKATYGRLRAHYEEAEQSGYILGAKLVRGAYMEKELMRAQQKKYANPVHDSKADTDHDFDSAVVFCFKRYSRLASCVATHNKRSIELACALLSSEDRLLNHPHIQFCQLYGMSDWMTTQISRKGYKTSKYLPYGSPYELIPYLVRRSQENSSAQEGINSELKVLKNELKRRRVLRNEMS